MARTARARMGHPVILARDVRLKMPRAGYRFSAARYGIRRQEAGFTLIEQVAAAALIAVVAPPLMLVLSAMMRGASISEAEVSMLNVARSQMESVKRQPYQSLPATYPTIDPIPEGYAVTTTAAAVKIYTFPAPLVSTTLTDEVQTITVQVTCPDCSPPTGPLTLEGLKARR